jgi:hypothetical protein
MHLTPSPLSSIHPPDSFVAVGIPKKRETLEVNHTIGQTCWGMEMAIYRNATPALVSERAKGFPKERFMSIQRHYEVLRVSMGALEIQRDFEPECPKQQTFLPQGHSNT